MAAIPALASAKGRVGQRETEGHLGAPLASVYIPLFLYTFNDTPEMVTFETMCTDPKVFNGYETSCRECDECVATYKNTWVARCVAEKRTLPHAYALTLTYADVNGDPPLGARVYRYKDVQDMWKRIRSAGGRRWGKDFELRYVIVGEKGTLKGRVHYHGVVFCNYPVHELGKLTSAMGGGFAYKRRLDWSIWGHGFVEFQPPDRKGMSYVLKYILKARMTSARSEGFGREGKTEWLASSYLWCSKVPAIGANWLLDKLDDMISKGICPPSLRVRVPGGGDWYVSGELQKTMCLYLRDANRQYNEDRGRDLAGWSNLIMSVEEEIENSETGEFIKRKPWEWLVNGEEENETDRKVGAEYAARSLDEWEEAFRERESTLYRFRQAKRTVERCGNIIPCKACGAGLSNYQRGDLEQENELRYHQWLSSGAYRPAKTDAQSREYFREWWRTRLRPSRGCQRRDEGWLQERFAYLVPIIKATHGLRYKKAIGKALQTASR